VIAKEAGLAKELIVYEDQVEKLKEENQFLESYKMYGYRHAMK
jgi:hypothetical protein